MGYITNPSLRLWPKTLVQRGYTIDLTPVSMTMYGGASTTDDQMTTKEPPTPFQRTLTSMTIDCAGPDSTQDGSPNANGLRQQSGAGSETHLCQSLVEVSTQGLRPSQPDVDATAPGSTGSASHPAQLPRPLWNQSIFNPRCAVCRQALPQGQPGAMCTTCAERVADLTDMQPEPIAPQTQPTPFPHFGWGTYAVCSCAKPIFTMDVLTHLDGQLEEPFRRCFTCGKWKPASSQAPPLRHQENPDADDPLPSLPHEDSYRNQNQTRNALHGYGGYLPTPS